MKKIFTLFSVSLLFTFFNGQTLNPTSSISAPGTADTFKGGYTFAYATSGTPWNGSLISFGGFSNNYDTQISAAYGVGNYISFRTRNGDYNNGAGKWNSWNEFWHSANLNNSTSDFTSRNLSTNGFVDINANGNIPQIRGNGGHIPTGLKFVDDSYTTQGQVKVLAIFKGYTWQKGLGFMRYDAVNRCAGGICDMPFMLYDNGDTQIGIADKTFDVVSKMSVQGNVKVDAKIEAKEVKVTSSPTADFVFEGSYALPKLEEVEKFIKENKHLPEISSAEEMEKEGVNIGEFQIKLLQKIEELTLYSIEQNKQIKLQAEKIEKLEKELSRQKSK
jgi:hypothetical protein